VTGDAGNCSAATAAEIHGLGGDYVLQVKGNQPTLLKFCEAAFAGLPRPAPIPRKGHGRGSPANAASQNFSSVGWFP